VLLFHAGSQTLLWAGRIGAQTEQDLLAAYPGLRADVLVMAADPPPGEAWLRSLQVRDWLQIPPRDLNSIPPMPWPRPISARSGLSTKPARSTSISSPPDNHPPEILLRPWLALPP